LKNGPFITRSFWMVLGLARAKIVQVKRQGFCWAPYRPPSTRV
jgi:hypothetical protein